MKENYFTCFVYFFMKFAVLFAFKLLSQHKTPKSVNNRPIIGIVAMSITDKRLLKTYPNHVNKSYIATSYVKYMEMTGARVVPITANMDEKTLKYIFKSINGLLFPGGEVNLINSGYHNVAKKLFNMGIKENEKGEMFPILGICRGMQAMMVFTEGDLSTLVLTDARNYSTSLNWTSAINESIFNKLPKELYKNTERSNITAHFHKYGIPPSYFTTVSSIRKRFKVLATSKDRNNKEFVSIFEGRKLPFYGIQFHPEKVLFEWAQTLCIAHSSKAVLLSQYIANAFMDQARKSTSHRFKNFEDEEKYLISKKTTFYTGNLTENHSPFVQMYIF